MSKMIRQAVVARPIYYHSISSALKSVDFDSLLEMIAQPDYIRGVIRKPRQFGNIPQIGHVFSRGRSNEDSGAIKAD